jgi:hypothetical protein
MLRVLIVAAATAAVYAQPTTCQGTPNLQAIWTGTPTLVNQTTNGIRMIAAPDGYDTPLTVLHVYGSDYEMGLAYGKLMQSEINTLTSQALVYLAASMNATVAEAMAALNMTYQATRPYTPPYWYAMLQGLSDGSGVEYFTLAGMSMIPELIKAQCSMMGAWGTATAGTSSKLVQLRALDWDTDGPFQQFPVLVTWHPTVGATHTTLGWAGMIGAITGISSSGMAISEKVWDAYKGKMSASGYVWTFLLQDILRFDMDTDQALSRIATANRTCAIWIGLGDEYNTQFKIVSYSNQLVNIYNPRNFPAYPPNHNQYDSLIFLNKHVQPSQEPCMNDVISWLYGNINGTATFQYVTAYEQTGDMHIMVMDWSNEGANSNYIYVSNASPGDGHGNGVTMAYDRPFLRFSTAAIFNQAAPAL